MLKIFKVPFVSRNSIVKGFVPKMLTALAVLMLAMIPMFCFMSRDSAANRNAVHKISSRETKLSVLFVAAVFIVVLIYICIVLLRSSMRMRRNFSIWAYYNGILYFVYADIPAASRYRRPEAVNRCIRSQDEMIRIFNDEHSVRQLLDGEISSRSLHAVEITYAEVLKEKKSGTAVMIPGGKRKLIHRDTDGYEQLLEIIRNLS